MAKLKIKVGDKVCVIAGKGVHSGKEGKEKFEGKVLKTMPDVNRVIIEGYNMITKHQKATGRNSLGGIIHKEAPVDASNVMLVCPKCSKPTRVGYKVADGKKTRVCKKCGEALDK